MAACGFGASSLKLSNLKLDSGRTKLGARQTEQNGLIIQNNTRFEGLLLSQQWKKPLTRCRCSASEAESAINSEENSEETIFSHKISPLFPNSYEVESLLTEICDTMSIAEFELKLGGFRLYVARDLTGKGNTPPPPISAPVSIATDAKAPDSNGSAYSESLAISKTLPPSNGVQTLLDKVADEGLVILQSPRVGYFRRSRTIKGKRAPQSCKEKQIVKEGQVICYIEQLGGELPVESDVSGEVIKILREDGDPVGYGDALIAILPSFPGIKKLQ